MKSAIVYFCSAAAILLTGCVSGWRLTEGTFDSSTYSIKTPVNWYEVSKGDHVFFTFHGRELEGITVHKFDWGDSLREAQVILKKTMLIDEYPKVFLADLLASGTINNFKMVEQSVITLDSLPAVKITYTFNKFSPHTMKSITVFSPHSEGLFIIDYTAPERYYFDKFKTGFDLILNSFKFKS